MVWRPTEGSAEEKNDLSRFTRWCLWGAQLEVHVPDLGKGILTARLRLVLYPSWSWYWPWGHPLTSKCGSYQIQITDVPGELSPLPSFSSLVYLLLLKMQHIYSERATAILYFATFSTLFSFLSSVYFLFWSKLISITCQLPWLIVLKYFLSNSPAVTHLNMGSCWGYRAKISPMHLPVVLSLTHMCSEVSVSTLLHQVELSCVVWVTGSVWRLWSFLSLGLNFRCVTQLFFLFFSFSYLQTVFLPIKW